MEAINNQYNDRTLAMQRVIRKLRADDLNQGHCFMIFDDDLPEDQAYYEYPNGNVNIEQLDKDNLDTPRKIVKVLTKRETAAVKEKHEVFR